MLRATMIRANLAFVVFCLIGGIQRSVAAGTLTLAPESAVWLVGDSTLHPFTSRTQDLQLTASLIPQSTAPALKAVLDEKALQQFVLAIPVKSLKSKEASLDKNMYKTMDADTYSDIRYALTSYDVHPSTLSSSDVHVQAKGLLTIAGHTQDVVLDMEATPQPKALHVRGHYELRMSDYGIKPPTMMLGTIKVKDNVVIHFDLILGSD